MTTFKTFNPIKNDQLKEPMFLGQEVNVARYDQQKYPTLDKYTEKALSFFWRPEEIDVSKDRIDFNELPENEKHIFISNLKYQVLLDSVQGRSPSLAFLPIVSLPELENWVQTWAFQETVHSRSYTHIIRNVFNDPSEIFDDIVVNPEIKKRAEAVSVFYDILIALISEYHTKDSNVNTKTLKHVIYFALVAVYALEAIRFYVSFACSFAFAERGLMEGNAKIIKLISRDEAIHMGATQFILNVLATREDEGFVDTVEECKELAQAIFLDTVEQEKEWAKYLFKDGSMIGLNEQILTQYIEYISNIRMDAIGLGKPFDVKTNPIPWINGWLNSDNVQVAPQETEISSYLVGQIDSKVDTSDFTGFDI